MSDQHTPSFSAGRLWMIFFSVIVSMVAVTALVVMTNYLGARYPLRFNLSREGKMELSPVTLSMLKSITNDVKVIIYYDRGDQLYPLVASQLDEYQQANPKILVRSVDYNKDATEAIKVATQYGLGSADAKNLVIFQCGTNVYGVDERLLADLDYAPVANETQPEFERKIKAFKGEDAFSEALMRVTHPKPMMACYLTGHLEHSLTNDSKYGYSSLKSEMSRINVDVVPIKLEGTNIVPTDCPLLIIAGPQAPIPAVELDKIRQYLAQGGHLLAMSRYQAAANRIVTGLEALLAEWGLGVEMNWLQDPANSDGAQVMSITAFNANSAVVKPFIKKYSLGLLLPRTIRKLVGGTSVPEGLKIDELAFTGPSVLVNDETVKQKGPFPVMASVEKANTSGVFNGHGTTRILAVGDSMFLDNEAIIIGQNASFAVLAAHWLIDQRQLPEEIASKKVIDSSVRMTQAQLLTVSWIFLGAMPGGVLLLGGLVWLSRRR